MPTDTPSPDSPVALIAEDEPLLAAELKEALQALWPQLQIRAVVHDGIAALHAAERERPSIAFLDIEMPRMTGLDVARQIARQAHIVFVTAYDQHALRAFDAGALDYVLKPIQIARLAETVERLKQRLGATPRDLSTALSALSSAPPVNAAPPRRQLQWINASQGSAVRLIMVDEVCYFKADNKYTLVVTPDSESLIRKTIRELQAELDPAQFRQVHRSTLANVAAIDRVLRDGGGMQIKFKSRPELLAVSEPYHALFRQM